MDLSSAMDYIKLYKDLKTSIPKLKKDQNNPENPESTNNAINFLWSVKVLYGKIKEQKKLDIPQVQFLDKLDSLPNEKEAFAQQVKENMLEVRNNQLKIKTEQGESEPIGDFSSNLLNEIENWSLALLGTFGGKK